MAIWPTCVHLVDKLRDLTVTDDCTERVKMARRAARRSSRPASDANDQGLRLGLSGYKSIHDDTHIDIKPLTLISGANSSGKSSFLQPFLLLKQTVESSFDPGPILVHGPNVQLTDWGQALSRGKSKDSVVRVLKISVKLKGQSFTNTYSWAPDTGLALTETEYRAGKRVVALRQNSTEKKIIDALLLPDSDIGGLLRRRADTLKMSVSEAVSKLFGDETRIIVRRDKCFLEPAILMGQERRSSGIFGTDISSSFNAFLSSILHVPGLRGNPLRTYTSAAAASASTGTVDQYVASVIAKWQTGDESEKQRLKALSSDLERLGLTWKIDARKLNDANVELRVGRMPRAQQGGAQDLVNIVDVGFGVSQTLPVLVALHAAAPGQIVYIEQPEIHLHPRAQAILGNILTEAAARGVYVVAETHSSLIVRAVQTAIARRQIPSDDVGLHWFYRDPSTGFSKVTAAVLDELGRFGDWPVDFDDVTEESDWAFVKSVQEAAHG